MKPQLQQLADDVIRGGLGLDPATWPLTQFVYVAFMFAAAGAVFVFCLHFAGLFIFFERRIAARMQARVGPNRVGPNGIIQWAVDGIKCLFKEDLVPTEADQPLFRIAPYFVVLGMLLAFAALPFSSNLIATDINIGLLFILGITALVAIGVLMSGWGSNSKWALLGGMRSAAQVISYEIPAGLAAMTVIILAGSLSLQDLIKAQAGAPWNWAFFHSPFVAVSFVIFFVAQLAEGNRTPFDLPEAESELVSGYNTEYSGMRFLMFFLGEFANVWILCALPVAMYFGGWQIPWGTMEDGITPATWLVGAAPYLFLVMLLGASLPALAIALGIMKYRGKALAAIDRAEIPGIAPEATRSLLKLGLHGVVLAHLGGAVGLVALGFAQLGLADTSLLYPLRNFFAINGIQLGIFMVKTLVLVFVVIQLRWTLPRIRVDQMMALCWKYMVPISFVCLVGTLVWELTIAKVGVLSAGIRILLMAASIVGVVVYVRRIVWNYKVSKDRWEDFKGTPQFYPPWRLP
jgi:NADH:ubiquinone oxidoreductase subunit H